MVGVVLVEAVAVMVVVVVVVVLVLVVVLVVVVVVVELMVELVAVVLVVVAVMLLCHDYQRNRLSWSSSCEESRSFSHVACKVRQPSPSGTLALLNIVDSRHRRDKVTSDQDQTRASRRASRCQPWGLAWWQSPSTRVFCSSAYFSDLPYCGKKDEQQRPSLTSILLK